MCLTYHCICHSSRKSWTQKSLSVFLKSRKESRGEKRKGWRKEKERKKGREEEILLKSAPLFEVHAASANFSSPVSWKHLPFWTNVTDWNHKILFSHSYQIYWALQMKILVHWFMNSTLNKKISLLNPGNCCHVRISTQYFEIICFFLKTDKNFLWQFFILKYWILVYITSELGKKLPIKLVSEDLTTCLHFCTHGKDTDDN